MNKIVEYGQGIVVYPVAMLKCMDVENKKRIKKAMNVGPRAPSTWLWVSKKDGGAGLSSMVSTQDTNLLAMVAGIVVSRPNLVGHMVLLNNMRVHGNGAVGLATVLGGSKTAPHDTCMPTTLAIIACLGQHNMDIVCEADMQGQGGGAIPRVMNPAACRAKHTHQHRTAVDQRMVELGLGRQRVAQSRTTSSFNDMLAQWGVALVPSTSTQAQSVEEARPLVVPAEETAQEAGVGEVSHGDGVEEVEAERRGLAVHHDGLEGEGSYGEGEGTWCWVDGLQVKGKAGGAVFFGWKSPRNQVFQVVGTQSSYNAELQAVDMAM